MTESAHTPGPWFIDRNHFGRIIGVAPTSGRNHDLDFVCCIDSDNHGDHEKNARLIAAAPELLAACKAVLDAIESTDLNGAVIWIRPPYQHKAVHESASERLAAVIAKAETL